jgi:Fe-S cluster biogenesis protein NfuA
MIEESEVRSALAEVAALVQADGGDIELVSVDTASGAVALRLLLESANCAECVLPKVMLEGVAIGMLQRSVPGVTGLSIDDPRDHPGYEAH